MFFIFLFLTHSCSSMSFKAFRSCMSDEQNTFFSSNWSVYCECNRGTILNVNLFNAISFKMQHLKKNSFRLFSCPPVFITTIGICYADETGLTSFLRSGKDFLIRTIPQNYKARFILPRRAIQATILARIRFMWVISKV